MGNEIVAPKSKAVGPNPKDLLGVKKPDMTKIPAVALLWESLAMMDGAGKYGPYNWRDNAVIASIYIAAIKRHLDEWFEGITHAEDSGCHHLGHARAGLGILLDAEATGNLIDDRPVKGESAKAYLQTMKEVASRIPAMQDRHKLFQETQKFKPLAIAVDAEGGIGIVKRESNRRENYTLRVIVYNTDRKFLDALQKEFGGSISKGHNPRSENHAIEYRLVWSHKQAKEIVEKIKPSLVIKKKQAEIALQFSGLVETNQPGRSGTPETLLVQLRDLKSKMNKLNTL